LTPGSPVPQDCGMGRHRKHAVDLPEHVHRVKAGGRLYFYYQAGRGKKKEERGARVKIAGDPYASAGSSEYLRFHAELNAIIAGNASYPRGSIGALVQQYRTDNAYTGMAERSQVVYGVHLNRFIKPEAWGLLGVDKLTQLRCWRHATA
jgi:hypothetical protein